MAITKSAALLLAATSVPVGNAQPTLTLDLSTALGAAVTAQVQNGATAPTIPCTAVVNVSPDGSSWVQWQQASAGSLANQLYPFGWEIPPGIMYVQVVFLGHTAQPVTVSAQAQTLASI